MAKKANTTMIGGFVVIAIFLLAASVVILGSGKLFEHTTRFVLFFDSSIKGLSVGSPVLFQGVQIGSVSSIEIHANRESLNLTIPVIIEVRGDRFYIEDKEHEMKAPAEVVENLVDRGLRGVLSMQSIITGQLMIELDFYPDSPVKMKKLATKYPEIPTIPSTSERLFQNLQKLDLSHVDKIFSGVDHLVNDPNLSEGLKSLRQAADDSRELVSKINRRIDIVVDDIENTLGDSRVLISHANGQVKPLVSDMRQLIRHFDELAINLNNQVDVVAGNLNKSLTGMRGVASEDAPLVIQMEETLQNISSMTDAIRQLADYLERHPESLLRGKDRY